MSRHTAPLGIKLIAGVTILVSFWGLFQSVLVIAAVGQYGGAAVLFGLLLGGFLALVNAARIAVSVGLLKLSSWAWTWSLVVFGLLTGIHFLNLVVNGSGIALLEILLNLVIMGYIWSKKSLYRNTGTRSVPEPNRV